MAERATMNISLPPTLRRFVRARVDGGRYGSASEVVREALRLLEERERAERAVVSELRRKISVGLEQARRGDLLDGEEVFAELAAPPRRRARR